MRVTYKPVRVIHWDRPATPGYAKFDTNISVRLTLDGITMRDELLFKLEERFRIYNQGTKEQAASWIAEQEILVKFNEGPGTAMNRSLQMIGLAHENFNDKFIETTTNDGCISGDMASPNYENMLIMAKKIVSVAQEEGLLRATRKRKQG